MMVMGLHALFYLTWILTVLLLLVLAVVVVKVGSDRARLALLPVVAFAMMAGTNYYWSDIVNGMPYVLTMAALVGVALLNGVPRLRPLAPFFIFGVGLRVGPLLAERRAQLRAGRDAAGPGLFSE